jgi:predicted DCC family thiol-disulfide oxidoreductase YuxK
MTERLASPALVYDGACPMCARSVRWARRWLHHLPPTVTYQDADLASLGLDEATCRAAVQYVAPDGTTHSGAEAVSALLQREGGAVGMLGSLMAHRYLRTPSRWIYQQVARRRRRGDDACSDDSCCAR